MTPPGSVEDLKKKKIYSLCEIPKTRFMDFGLLYEKDKGEYLVLNEVRMAYIRLASLVYFLFMLARIACLLHFCVKTGRFDYSIWATPK